MLARFRTGCHCMQLCTGRRCQLQYSDRRCPSCRCCVEDETRAILYCRTYTFQRLIFTDRFTNDTHSLVVNSPALRVDCSFLAGLPQRLIAWPARPWHAARCRCWIHCELSCMSSISIPTSPLGCRGPSALLHLCTLFLLRRRIPKRGSSGVRQPAQNSGL